MEFASNPEGRPGASPEREAAPEAVELSPDFWVQMGMFGVNLHAAYGDGQSTGNLIPSEVLALADFIESHRDSLKAYEEQGWQTHKNRMMPPVSIETAEDLARGPQPIPRNQNVQKPNTE